MIKTNRVLSLAAKWTVSVCSLSPRCICWQMIIRAVKMCHLLFIGWQPNNLCLTFLTEVWLSFYCSHREQDPTEDHSESLFSVSLATYTKLRDEAIANGAALIWFICTSCVFLYKHGREWMAKYTMSDRSHSLSSNVSLRVLRHHPGTYLYWLATLYLS